MAILKEIELENGAVVTYHRINSINLEIIKEPTYDFTEEGLRVEGKERLKYQLIVNYSSYVSEAKRREDIDLFIGTKYQVFNITLEEAETGNIFELAYRKLQELLGGTAD